MVRYDPAVIDRLGVVRMARQAGHRLDATRGRLADRPGELAPAERWRELAPSSLQEIDAEISRLVTVRRVVEDSQRRARATLGECAAHGWSVALSPVEASTVAAR